MKINLCCLSEDTQTDEDYHNKLYGIKFENQYIGLFKCYGPYNYDSEIYVTNKKSYLKMIQYLRQFEETEDIEELDINKPLDIGFVKV